MAITDISYKALNNQKRATNASVGSLDLIVDAVTPVVSGDTYISCFLPRGAMVTDITVIPVTSFNAGTSCTLSVGNAGSATAYTAAIDIKATTVVKTTPAAPIYLPTGDSVYLFPVWVGTAPTTGSVRVVINYTEVNTLAGSYNN